MSKNDFSIFINSRTNAVDSGGLNAEKSFRFNFNAFKQGHYKVSFTFVGNENNVSPSTPAYLSIDFGSNQQVYFPERFNSSFQNSKALGLLYPHYSNINPQGHLQALFGDNAPVVMQRPNTSQFTVYVRNDQNDPYTDAAAANELTPYLLMLKFEYISED